MEPGEEGAGDATRPPCTLSSAFAADPEEEPH